MAGRGKFHRGSRGQSDGRHRKKPDNGPLPPAVEVQIRDLNHSAQGVGRVAGRTLFVDGALPGETVLAKYRQRRGKFDVASTEQVIEPSAQRVEPRCKHFGRCGGCQLQHLSSDSQLHHKQTLLLRTVEKIAGAEPRNLLPVLSASPWHYRRRARLAVRYLAKASRLELGFREADSDRIIAISECPILAPPFDGLLEPLRLLLQSLSAPDKVPQLELLTVDSGSAINIHLLKPLAQQDQQKLLAFGAQHQIQIYCQLGGADNVQVLSDPLHPLSYRLAEYDLQLQVQPGGFLQVNAEVNRLLVNRAVQMLQLADSDRVLDLFCGLGNFTLPLARRCEYAVGVEGSDRAIEAARVNAADNGIGNSDFYVADLSRDQSAAPWAKQQYDAVLLDPPRAGAREILPVVAATGAKRVLYISCHPGSMARDIGDLIKHYGYRLDSAGAVDMFPQTAHLESVVLLVKD